MFGFNEWYRPRTATGGAGLADVVGGHVPYAAHCVETGTTPFFDDSAMAERTRARAVGPGLATVHSYNAARTIGLLAQIGRAQLQSSQLAAKAAKSARSTKQF